MNDTMLREISRLTHLKTLRLGGSTAVTDEGVRWLSGLSSLRYLDLSGTSITDAGLTTLAQLPQLTRVSLAWTRVSDAGASALASCHALEHVDLGGTWCGDGALRALAGKPMLRWLASGSAVTDAGIAALHEYPVFKRWHEGDVPFALITQEHEPNRLSLRGSFTDHGVARLQGLDGLFALDLGASELNLTGHSLAPLIQLPNLGSLSFDAKDDAMPYIARLPRLRFLDCQDTAASDDGWVALGASQSIERIWGRRCYGLGNRGFKAVSGMPMLRSLSASCRNVEDAVLALLPTFPALRALMPMDIPDDGYRHIGRCTSLETLTLMYCRDTTDVATAHITALPRLTEYFASYTQITDRTPELLAGMASLERVTFDSCAKLTNDGIAHLARLPRLQELRVSGRGLTRDVTKPFPSSVTVQYSL
jgi:Leucine-rich repeat (LRR) protein